MRFAHFIPHVNNLHLTMQALRSTLGTVAEGHVIVIDNSAGEELASVDLPGQPEVLWPPVPLTTAQTMNWMRRVAILRDLDVFGFQHNDGEPHAGTVDALYRMAEERTEPWGVLFSHYDVCCVFNRKAVEVVGEWDWLLFPFYHLDNDYYARLDAAGYPQVHTGLGCTHHNDASNTIKSDPRRKQAVQAYFNVSESLLRQKYPNR